jgi:K+-transporting ATPase ATPase B chain
MATKIYVAAYVHGPAVPATKSQTQSAPAIKSNRTNRWAFRLKNYRQQHVDGPASEGRTATAIRSNPLVLEAVAPDRLQTGDIILVEAGQTIPADGRVVEGTAHVDELAITGQSAPALRGTGGNSDVMRDSQVISGTIFVEVMPRRGHPLDWIGGNAAPSVARAPVLQR